MKKKMYIVFFITFSVMITTFILLQFMSGTGEPGFFLFLLICPALLISSEFHLNDRFADWGWNHVLFGEMFIAVVNGLLIGILSLFLILTFHFAQSLFISFKRKSIS